MSKILEFDKEEMEKSGDKNSPDLLFFCPGCKMGHEVWTTRRNGNNCVWTYNGNKDLPTINPSLLVRLSDRDICHSFIRDGKIQFLSDCTHSLAGQTVELPEIS